MSHETCEHCDKPLRLCACTEDFDGPKYIGPTECAFCGEPLDDPEEDGPTLRNACQALADMRTLDAFQTAGNHVSAPEQWPDGRWVIYTQNATAHERNLGRSQEAARAVAAAWVRSNPSQPSKES